MTLVKICGVRDADTARCAFEAGADLVGLVFAPSRRRVTLAEAVRISAGVPCPHRLVGVFVNESADTVRMAVRECGLGFAQLAGDESAEYCRSLGVPLLRAVRLSGEVAGVQAAEFGPLASMLVLNAFVPGAYGGTGEVGDWELASRIARDHVCLLAGGLTPDNVSAAIERVQPHGVDVSGGVEVAGVKSRQLIEAFILKAKEAGDR